MRREYRRPLFLCLGVLLQLLAFWRMQVVGGGCDAGALLFEGVVLLLCYIFCHFGLLTTFRNWKKPTEAAAEYHETYALYDLGGVWATSRFRDSKKTDRLLRYW